MNTINLAVMSYLRLPLFLSLFLFLLNYLDFFFFWYAR